MNELTVNEVAEELGITRAAVYRAIQEGRLQAHTFKGLRLVHRRQLELYAAQIGKRRRRRRLTI